MTLPSSPSRQSEALQPDLRHTARWARVEAHFRALYPPGSMTDPSDPSVSADGRTVACTVTVRDDLDSPAHTAVLVAGPHGERTFGSRDLPSRLPRFAPSGDALALVHDRADGRSIVRIVEGDDAVELPPLHGVVEHLAWSPDGARLVATVAEPGADAAGAQGSGRLSRGEAPSWMPVVLADTPVGGWRRAWCIRPSDTRWEQVSPAELTCWEVAWCGPDRLLVIASDRPEEAAWFSSRAMLLDLASGAPRELGAADERCIGLPAGTHDGRWAAWVAATCSDRTVVAGDVMICDLTTGEVAPLDTAGIDVTWQAFVAEHEVLVAGQRGTSTVIAAVDVRAGRITERRWSAELTCGQRYPSAACSSGRIAIVAEGYRQPPELTVLDADGTPNVRVAFRHPGHDEVLGDAGRLREFEWVAPDGVRIEGLLVTPESSAHGPGPTRASRMSTVGPCGRGARAGRWGTHTRCSSPAPGTPCSTRTRVGRADGGKRSGRPCSATWAAPRPTTS